MKRVRNTDIEFKLDKKLINISNFSMKFYTVNADNFYIRKTNEDVYEKERPATIEDEDVIASGGTAVTEYYVALDWQDLENIGRGVMNYQAVNNYNINDFVDLWYNKGVQRTTEYYIDSDVIFSDADGRNVMQKLDDFDRDLKKEIEDRIDGDLVLADRIDYIVEHLDSGGTIDPTKYYLKTETSGATELSNAFDLKQDVLIAGSGITISGNVISAVGGGGGDMSNYYTKDETSGATELSNAFADKLDFDVFSAYSATINTVIEVIEDNEEVVSSALNDLNNRKLDASAYTPTDLSNYYRKTETSGATELTAALANKQDVLSNADVLSVITSTDVTNWNNKSDFSGSYNDLTDKLSAGTGIAIVDNVISADVQSITIDSNLDSGSTNPVANSAITTAINDKLSASNGQYIKTIGADVDSGWIRYMRFSTPSEYNYFILDNPKINGKQIHKLTGVPSEINQFSLVESSAITTTITSGSTDSQVPSAKAVYDAIGDIETLLSNI